MALEFNPDWNRNQIEKFIRDRIRGIEEEMLRMMQFVGEDFIKNSRLNGSYIDHSGNLRSSIGYCIVKEGLQWTIGGFQPIHPKGKQKLGTIIGPEVGEDLIATTIKRNGARYAKGICLIGCAGMNYGIYVESRGRDVITGSATIAINELQKSIERIKEKYNRKNTK